MFYGGSKSGESRTSEYERMRAACDALKRAAERRINNTKKRKPTVTYLVMLRCHSDDIPLLITTDETKAREFAAQLVNDKDLGEREAEILSIDISRVCNVSLYTFDERGMLVDQDCLKEFD